MYVLSNGKKQAKIWANKVEQSAIIQIENTMNHPRLFKHVAIMPDVHMGWGATIGSVIPLQDAIIPAAVGVDIGCGMCAVKTNLISKEITPYFDYLYKLLKFNIPAGFSHRETNKIEDIYYYTPPDFITEVTEYEKKYPNKPILPQLGTLGGGNHFIELQKDEDGYVWIMLHSGSRNIGYLIADTYIKKARALSNASEDLEYLEEDSPDGKEYIKDMNFALDFAYYNRMIMVEIIKHDLGRVGLVPTFEPMINIHHNYAVKETHFGEKVWVHRKGATKVSKDITGIIPGSMGSPSYIVIGKDNEDSYFSCSHGAGRCMSRNEAGGKRNRKTGVLKTEGKIKIESFQEIMDGVYSHDVNEKHLDEAPQAYKDIDEVMKNQEDLVEIKTKLIPIFNMKG